MITAERSFEGLTRAMRDPRGAVRAAALKGLIELDDARTRPHVIAALDDRSDQVRALAMIAMADDDDAALVEVMERRLDDPQPWIFAAADAFLARVAPDVAVPRRLERWRRWLHKRDYTRRVEAVRALQRMGGRARPALPDLCAQLTCRYWPLRASVVVTLAALGDPCSLPAIIGQRFGPRGQQNRLTLRALARFDDPRARAAIRECLTLWSYDRRVVVEAMALAGDREGLEVALRDGDRWVARAARRALDDLDRSRP